MGLSSCWIVPMLALGLFSCAHPGACAEQEIDTQFIFGFTAGADVGELGEKEIEHETIGLLGKRGGSYLGLTDEVLAEFVPVKDFRFEIGLPFAYCDIAGVSGFDQVHRGAFDGLSARATSSSTASIRRSLSRSELSPTGCASMRIVVSAWRTTAASSHLPLTRRS